MTGPEPTPLIPTEQSNPATAEIDLLPIPDMLRLINEADRQVPEAVSAAIPAIAEMVGAIVAAFNAGGRLFYIGAGTSGRLGVLDASECLPTFSVPPELVQGIIAGGDTALRHPVEGAEDSADAGREAVATAGIGPKDVLIGLSASGGAAYVVAAVEAAKARGAKTGAVTCHPGGALAQAADIAMVAEVGPEILAGSSRMKAGTAQKLILNMLSTGAMIAWGKTYRNLMVDLKPTNIKLKARATRLVSLIAEIDPDAAGQALAEAGGEVKTAIVMRRLAVDADRARALLTARHGKLRAVLSQPL